MDGAGDGHIATHQILMEIFFGLASKDGQIETRKKKRAGMKG
jgi:hypothetical protein